MPSEPPSIFQSPSLLKAGEDMLDWAHNWQRQRRLAAAQDDSGAENSDDDSISGGGGDDVADSTRADDLTGQVVVLPDGSKVPDSNSWAGYMMSPVADLSHVAVAGRRTGSVYRTLSQIGALSRNPLVRSTPLAYLYGSLGVHFRHGGLFDYQREGNSITGFTQRPEFRNVSNFNVGLFGQQAGLSLDETKSIASAYAQIFSNNAHPENSYGLDTDTADYIERGYEAGQSGIFDRSRETTDLGRSK